MTYVFWVFRSCVLRVVVIGGGYVCGDSFQIYFIFVCRVIGVGGSGDTLLFRGQFGVFYVVCWFFQGYYFSFFQRGVVDSFGVSGLFTFSADAGGGVWEEFGRAVFERGQRFFIFDFFFRSGVRSVVFFRFCFFVILFFSFVGSGQSLVFSSVFLFIEDQSRLFFFFRQSRVGSLSGREGWGLRFGCCFVYVLGV